MARAGAEVNPFAKRILFLSPELEAEGRKQQSRSNLLDSLDAFEQLAASVQSSFEPPKQTVAVPAAPNLTPASAPAATTSASRPAQQPAYTAKKEYQAALRSNQGLINALLDYHRKATPRRSSILRPGESTGFVSAKIPEVKAEIKDERSISRSNGLAYPILRSR